MGLKINAKIDEKKTYFFMDFWSILGSKNIPESLQKPCKKRDQKRERKCHQKSSKNKAAMPEPEAAPDHFPPPNHPPYNSQSSNIASTQRSALQRASRHQSKKRHDFHMIF